MKCIVIETSPERTNAKPVANEDGTPHVYATLTKARAELKANGYSYNRANDRYYLAGTEYRAYIIREDSDEYAEIMLQTEQAITEAVAAYDLAIEAASMADALASRAINSSAEEAAKAAENARHYAGRAQQWAAVSKHWAGQTRASEAHSAAESAAEVADYASRRAADAAESAAEAAANEAYCASIIKANRAALALLDAYAEAIGEYPEEDDPETVAAYRVARDEITGTGIRASDYDRATVDLMTDIVARATRRPDLSKYADMKYLELEPEPAPVYQPYELEAFLGEPDAYDVDAIEAEATAYDPRTGARVWTAFGDDLAAIAERHELYTV